MNKKSKQYPNPKFSNIEEEDKYWETHSPLNEGFEGEIETSEQKRSSFLSVRMTGDELSQLRDMATKLGVGPSTYARLILRNAIDNNNWPTPHPFNDIYNSNCNHESKPKSRFIYLMDADDINIPTDMVKSIIRTIVNNWKCRVVTPNDDDYNEVESLMRTRP